MAEEKKEQDPRSSLDKVPNNLIGLSALLGGDFARLDMIVNNFAGDPNINENSRLQLKSEFNDLKRHVNKLFEFLVNQNVVTINGESEQNAQSNEESAPEQDEDIRQIKNILAKKKRANNQLSHSRDNSYLDRIIPDLDQVTLYNDMLNDSDMFDKFVDIDDMDKKDSELIDQQTNVNDEKKSESTDDNEDESDADHNDENSEGSQQNQDTNESEQDDASNDTDGNDSEPEDPEEPEDPDDESDEQEESEDDPVETGLKDLAPDTENE